MLTKKDAEKVYEYAKNNTLEAFIKEYCVNDIKDVIYFKCYIPFKRGTDYEFDGLITRERYNKINKYFDCGHELSLGEINGKHSEGMADRSDFTFRFGDNVKDKSFIEQYIVTYGYLFSDNYFWDHGLDECNNDNCNCDTMSDVNDEN